MVELERKGAQALYKSLGFEIQSKRDDYYKLGRHAYYMELNLIQQ
jgi:ribosomal protein S18 acetylase RimI-like enzyme